MLQRTASALSWWASSDRASGEPAPLPHTLETIAETAVEGGYSAGIGLGFCLPIKSPAVASFGHANLETHTRIDNGSLFRIGACTHQIIAAAILLLVERNKLHLTDKVGHALRGDDGSDTESVHDLLLGDAAAYVTLGQLIEHVASESLAGFVTDNLLIPAGMTASRFTDATRITPHRASGYRLSGDRAHDFSNAGAGQDAAADELHANAGDLLLWNRALHNGRLLTRGTVDMMTATGVESPPCPALAPFTERHKRGLGIEVGRIFGRRAFWRRGQAPGFDTWLFHFPDDRADLALLANTEQGAATILEPILRAILRV
ncbi:serine hydrolase domain-containing protein [Sphingomonas crusticola]|uniref:serine hydrolase domain-containing protein n=1 Tax=Sphingomonas crusticola TaxID=1697973 RepID=UPI0013C2ADE5|nr:serine hydrolase domain-containing protein [Sphingomonas crusticola]